MLIFYEIIIPPHYVLISELSTPYSVNEEHGTFYYKTTKEDVVVDTGRSIPPNIKVLLFDGHKWEYPLGA